MAQGGQQQQRQQQPRGYHLAKPTVGKPTGSAGAWQVTVATIASFGRDEVPDPTVTVIFRATPKGGGAAVTREQATDASTGRAEVTLSLSDGAWDIQAQIRGRTTVSETVVVTCGEERKGGEVSTRIFKTETKGRDRHGPYIRYVLSIISKKRIHVRVYDPVTPAGRDEMTDNHGVLDIPYELRLGDPVFRVNVVLTADNQREDFKFLPPHPERPWFKTPPMLLIAALIATIAYLAVINNFAPASEVKVTQEDTAVSEFVKQLGTAPRESDEPKRITGFWWIATPLYWVALICWITGFIGLIGSIGSVIRWAVVKAQTEIENRELVVRRERTREARPDAEAKYEGSGSKWFDYLKIVSRELFLATIAEPIGNRLFRR